MYVCTDTCALLPNVPLMPTILKTLDVLSVFNFDQRRGTERKIGGVFDLISFLPSALVHFWGLARGATERS